MWTCPKCREENDDAYEVCYNCGTSQEGEEDPRFRRAEETGAEYEGDRPLVEAIPTTNIPAALQPREPAPVPHPKWREVRCPSCQSEDLARDTASPWPVIAGAIILGAAWSMSASAGGIGGAGVLSFLVFLVGLVVLVAGLLAPFFTDNAWCCNCGVRFKKRFRIERPAEDTSDS